jgi:hypothetical protein
MSFFIPVYRLPTSPKPSGISELPRLFSERFHCFLA